MSAERGQVRAERDELQSKLDELGKSHDAELQRQRTAHEQIRQQHQKDLLAVENLKSEIEAELAIRVELGQKQCANKRA